MSVEEVDELIDQPQLHREKLRPTRGESPKADELRTPNRMQVQLRS